MSTSLVLVIVSSRSCKIKNVGTIVFSVITVASFGLLGRGWSGSLIRTLGWPYYMDIIIMITAFIAAFFTLISMSTSGKKGELIIEDEQIIIDHTWLGRLTLPISELTDVAITHKNPGKVIYQMEHCVSTFRSHIQFKHKDIDYSFEFNLQTKAQEEAFMDQLEQWKDLNVPFSYHTIIDKKNS